MNKRRGTNAIRVFALLFAFSFIFFSQAVAAEKAEDLQVKGQVKAVTNKAKTVSVSVKDKGVMLFKFNDSTKFINFTKTKEIKYPTAVFWV